MKKKLCILLTLTALVLLFCGASACAELDSKMHWSYPQPDDDMIYHWEMEKNVGEVDFSDVAMYLEFDVRDSGKQHLISAQWLPGLVGDDAEDTLEMNQSFYEHLIFCTEYQEGSDIYGKNVDELTEESGLGASEAQNDWYTSIQTQARHTYPYRIEIMDNFQLRGRDLILGAYGAEALSVVEAELNGMDMIKATVDYTRIYDDIELSDEDWGNLQKSIVKNYVFLFDNEGEYLISISGTSDMDVLEKIGENLLVRETELSRTTYDNGLDYIFHDMARG